MPQFGDLWKTGLFRVVAHFDPWREVKKDGKIVYEEEKGIMRGHSVFIKIVA